MLDNLPPYIRNVASSDVSNDHSNNRRTYLFYDNVHLVKNIRNNLLNVKKYVFPAFESKIGGETFRCPAGYISWSDLVYGKDKELQGNLRKVRKLSYKTLHPGNNKQDVGFWHYQFLMREQLLLSRVTSLKEMIVQVSCP